MHSCPAHPCVRQPCQLNHRAVPHPLFPSLQLVHMVSGGERLPVPPCDSVPGAAPDPELYEAYVALIRRCWAQRPEERPGFAEIIQELKLLSRLA